MPEQLTYYHDVLKTSPFCFRVEIALIESGASYKSCGFDIYSKPEWFARVNPHTGKIPAITYGGPDVPPEDPSPLSFKLSESFVLLEFLADLFPNSSLLPPVSDVTGRACVRRFVDVARNLEQVTSEFTRGLAGNADTLVACLEKVQALLPDHFVESGEFAIGHAFTIADCAIVPSFGIIELIGRTDLGRYEAGQGTQLGQILASEKFERLSRYKKALFERVSVKKVIDLDHVESIYRTRITRN